MNNLKKIDSQILAMEIADLAILAISYPAAAAAALFLVLCRAMCVLHGPLGTNFSAPGLSCCFCRRWRRCRLIGI